MPADGGPARVRRTSLREQVANALREEMTVGRLAAGSSVTVREVAELYGVSATPAREALVDLTAQGLLRVEHHRGFAVTELTWEDFLGITEARTLVAEGLLRRRGCAGRIDRERLPSLRRRAEAATGAARAGRLDVLVGCDRRFWHEAGLLLGNRRVSDYLDWLRVQAWMYAAPRLRARPEHLGACWDGHAELAERVAAGDCSGAHRMVLEYYRHGVELMARLGGHDPGAARHVHPADGCGPHAAPGEDG